MISKKNKVHVVVALPFRANMPYDPNWYTPEYVNYIAGLLPADRYDISGYFVSLLNIPQFLNDTKTLYEQKGNVCVLNICDGGEWDQYPGISVVKKWEEHPINKLVPISGADSEFIFNSDDKARMQSFIGHAKLKTLPQVLIRSQEFDEIDLVSLLAENQLDQAWPLFCKLNIGAGALGVDISFCRNLSELRSHLKEMHARYPQSDILIQPYLSGPEYTVLVLKDRVYAAVRRDFHNPYNMMLEDYLLKGSIVANEITYYPASDQALEVAVKAIQAIPGKHHYTRVDMREDGRGNIYVIDINDRPGIGNPGTVNTMLDYLNLTVAQLVLDIVSSARKLY